MNTYTQGINPDVIKKPGVNRRSDSGEDKTHIPVILSNTTNWKWNRIASTFFLVTEHGMSFRSANRLIKYKPTKYV